MRPLAYFCFLRVAERNLLVAFLNPLTVTLLLHVVQMQCLPRILIRHHDAVMRGVGGVSWPHEHCHPYFGSICKKEFFYWWIFVYQAVLLQRATLEQCNRTIGWSRPGAAAWLVTRAALGAGIVQRRDALPSSY